jgi:hypothetical protein
LRDMDVKFDQPPAGVRLSLAVAVGGRLPAWPHGVVRVARAAYGWAADKLIIE